MEQDKKQTIALMRYSAISPVVAGTRDDFASLNAYFRDTSARGIKGADGKLRHYSPGTIEKWYLSYKHSGFEGLVPAGRTDCGVSRKIDEELQEEIRYLKHTYPRCLQPLFTNSCRTKGVSGPDSFLNPPSAVSLIS